MTRRQSVPIRFLLPLLMALGACSDSATEPAATFSDDVFVLNSTGQTLSSFSVLGGLEGVAAPLDLGAGFDGDAFDLTTSFAVTTVSAFGGSRLLFVDLASGDVLTTAFPAPESDLTNPSAASFDAQGTAWVGGRGSDAIYRARPGDPVAERGGQCARYFHRESGSTRRSAVRGRRQHRRRWWIVRTARPGSNHRALAGRRAGTGD